jgi:hypothetical protein
MLRLNSFSLSDEETGVHVQEFPCSFECNFSSVWRECEAADFVQSFGVMLIVEKAFSSVF